MDLKLTTYLIYLLVSIGLTVWVARTLMRNGQVFLDDAFDNQRPLARRLAASAGSLRGGRRQPDGYGQDCGGTCDI